MRLGGWVITLVAMSLFLTIIGVDSGITAILEKIGVTANGMDIKQATFYLTLLSAFAVVGAGGAIVVGLFAKSYDVSLIILPFVTFVLSLFITVFHSIFLVVSAYEIAWLTWIITIIFGSLTFGFIMACVDYFAGR